MRNKKQWLAVILVLSALAITFIWGGDYNGGSTGYEESSAETQAVNNTAPSQTVEAQHNEEYNVQADINTGKADGNTSDSETKELVKVFPDSSAEVTKSTSETDKGQKKDVIKIQEVEHSQKVQDAASAKTSSNQEDKKTNILPILCPRASHYPYMARVRMCATGSTLRITHAQ